MLTTAESRTRVYDLERQTRALFDRGATILRLQGLGHRVTALVETRADADQLRALIASCDRDIYEETARALGVGHQHRDRSVPCQRRCGRRTWEYHGVCTACGPQICQRCEAGL